MLLILTIIKKLMIVKIITKIIFIDISIEFMRPLYSYLLYQIFKKFGS
jgi:hypothetical protein